jgi:ATP-dependent Lon protease
MTLPVLPLRNTVLFPSLFMPLAAGRPSSVAALEAVMGSEEKLVVLVAQRDATADQPTVEQLYTVGTKAVVKKMARTQEGVELLVQGIERVVILKIEQTEPYFRGRVQTLPQPNDTGPEVEALYRAVLDLAGRVIELAQSQNPLNLSQLAAQAQNPMQMVYLFGSMLSLDVAREQALLEAATVVEALRLLHGYLSHEVQVLELRNKITSQAQTEMGKEQREYLLRQQLRAIQEELGEKNPEKAEVDELRRRLKKPICPTKSAKKRNENWARWSASRPPRPISR